MRFARFLAVPLLAGLLGLSALVAGGGDRPAEPGPVPGDYAGERTCKKCHFKETKAWKETKHAKSFELLPERHRADAQCLACHVTGHGQPGGFVSLSATPEHAAVSCEACHGPGKGHAAFAKENETKKDDPAVKARLAELLVARQPDCARCHLAQRHKAHPDYEGKGKK